MQEQTRSDDQRIWDYIGRNRLFSVADISLITDIDQKEIEAFCRSFEKAGYLKREEERYRCVKYNGKIVPVIADDGSVNDPNMTEKRKQRARASPKQAILKTILEYPEETFSRRDIRVASERHYKAVFEAMDEFKEKGVIVEAEPKRHGKSRYRVHPSVRYFCEVFQILKEET